MTTMHIYYLGILQVLNQWGKDAWVNALSLLNWSEHSPQILPWELYPGLCRSLMFCYRQLSTGLTAQQSRIELSKPLDFTMFFCCWCFRCCSCKCSRHAGLAPFLENNTYQSILLRTCMAFVYCPVMQEDYFNTHHSTSTKYWTIQPAFLHSFVIFSLLVPSF